MVKKLARLIVFGSFFIAACAVALCIESNLLLSLPLNNFAFYLFVFCATILQYNLHYLIKKKANFNSERFSWSQRNKQLHKIFSAISFAGVSISLFFLQLQHFKVVAVLCIIATLYSFPVLPLKKKRLKEFGLLKIIILSLEWALVTVWLPLAQENLFTTTTWLIFLRRFIFIFIL
jgi:hypothetical protein